MLSYTIEVDLDVFKALTAKIESEGQTHNDVLRNLMALDSIVEADDAPAIEQVGNAIARAFHAGRFYSRGLVLPDGTQLRARYKGRIYQARIEEGEWIDVDGNQHSSPSSAASAITGTTVNGWRFWEALRPGDRGWLRLDILNAKR